MLNPTAGTGHRHPQYRLIGVLDYAEVTANQTSLGSGLTDLTGLTVTVTVPAGRRLRITANVRLSKITSAGWARVAVREGSTVLGYCWFLLSMAIGGVSRYRGEGSVIVTPSAGSHTYKLSAELENAGADLEASGTGEQNWILVEDIGAA